MNGNSERIIGRVLKKFGRDKIHVCTKFHLRGKNWNTESIIKSVEASLKRLDTDYVDVLSTHGASEKEQLTDERVLNAFEKLKKQGKFRFQGLSCHKSHYEVIKRAVECGYYDMVQIAYNVFDIKDYEKEIEKYDDYLGASGLGKLIKLAKSKDVGVIAMKTLKVGGKRQNLERYKIGNFSIYQAMLKRVLENRDISSVVTEMLNFKQLKENLSILDRDLTYEERKALYAYVFKNSKGYCHMCGLCERKCPSGIKTTEILRYLAYYESYLKEDYAKNEYAKLKKNEKTFCTDCGECERVCPYNVPIREKLKLADRILTI